MAELLTGTYEDIPRYYTAIAEWISCMLFCYFYRRKIKKSCFAGIAAGMLVLQTGWLMLTGNVSTLFWIAIGMMFLFLWMVIEATWKMVAYCCMKAFLTAEFMASLEWQLEYFAYRGRTEKGVLSILTLAIVYGAVTMILWIIESRMKRDEIELEISVKELYSTLHAEQFKLRLSQYAVQRIHCNGYFYDPDAGGFWRACNPVCLSEPTA